MRINFKKATIKNLPNVGTLCTVVQQIIAPDGKLIRRYTQAWVDSEGKKKVFRSTSPFCECVLKGVTHFSTALKGNKVVLFTGEEIEMTKKDLLASGLPKYKSLNRKIAKA